ncbi:MAG: hypothetical protein AAF934_06220 [Bacteroidota bacterium]
MSKYYECLPFEVDKFLNKHSFNEIWAMNDLLTMIEGVRMLKIRLPNPTMNKSKSGGFRLILILDKSKQTISLLYVYPKMGKMKIENISKSYEKYLLKQYLNELESNSLQKTK